MTNLDDNRPTCNLFFKNRCPTGIKCLKCTHHHPKQCHKFLQCGRTEHGCQDWKCHLLHPRICRNSYFFGSCHRTGCKERHTKHQQQPSKQPEDQGDQAFLWQKQIQEQIDKLANTNLQILQVLSQCQQRPIQVWIQASHQPQSSLLPSLPKWPATNGQWLSLHQHTSTTKRTIQPSQCAIRTVQRELQRNSVILNLLLVNWNQLSFLYLSNHDDKLISINGYQLHNSGSRDAHGKSRIIAYTRGGSNLIRRSDLESQNAELIIFDKVSPNTSFIDRIIGLYRPFTGPDGDSSSGGTWSHFTHLIETINLATDGCHRSTILGDINVDLLKRDCASGCYYDVLETMCNKNSFEQLIQHKTQTLTLNTTNGWVIQE